MKPSSKLIIGNDLFVNRPIDHSEGAMFVRSLGCHNQPRCSHGRGRFGFRPSSQLHRSEVRGCFDDSDDEAQEQTRPSPLRRGDRSVLSIPGVEGHTPVLDRPSTSTGGDEEGVQQPAHKRRGGPQKEGAGLAKKYTARTPQTTGGERKGVEGQEGTSGRKRPTSVQKQPQSGALEAKGPIDINATYFLEWKDSVRTKREFFISPSRVVEIGEWEASYNQRSLDPVHTQLIIDAMRMTFSQAEKTYELLTLKLAPLEREKPKPGVRADRLKPEDWKHNAAAAKALLDTDVALRYNFERWPASMVYFSDEEFEGYFLVSSEDNKKDLKAPPRQLKLSMKDIRWLWKEKGFPKAVMGNPNGKQAHVQKWREFCAHALHKTPYNHLWILVDEKGEDNIKNQNAALRSYFPLVMAGKSAWELGMEFFKKWETGRLLTPEGAKWITKKRKVKDVRPGVSHIKNEKLGQKEIVYNVPVLNCKVLWVQTGSASLAKQGKLGVQEAVHLLKCDLILVRLWNYYQFMHENRADTDCTRAYPFLKKREAILVEFEKQGMDPALWDGSRKLVSDASLFKDCPPYIGCEDVKMIKATEKLALNKKLSAEWKNKVLSVLTDSRAKSMEVALAEGVVHVLWKDSGDMTSIAPFSVDPLEAQMRVTKLEKAVGTTKCHTCVLDLRDPVDFKQWTPEAIESLNSLLEQLFPSHRTVVAFVPLRWDYSFMTDLRHLPVVKAMAGKWVRRTQQKKRFPVGNNLYSADNRMHVLFKGDDLRENTCDCRKVTLRLRRQTVGQ
ncbi:hypothetical protein CBR_g25765 [Chara braunii]|uniref:Uncharacterized protein n=1 Tax=Chara braunii TaxID=69332 RepID=A0A388L699_CHABU|nr:hypothetical protein CBR_g25765 [Chara braunii]|eukprot:GBG77835.1 hypothetical protein CBR_g25765 [Chara braunii]